VPVSVCTGHPSGQRGCGTHTFLRKPESRHEISDLTISRRLYLGFGIIIAILIMLVAIAYRNIAQLGQANDINIHTYRVLGKVNGALEQLINIETGQRGYALTGNIASLEPYNAGKLTLREHLDAALKLTADNPAQQERLHRLDQAQQDWLSNAVDPVIALRRSHDDEQIQAVLASSKRARARPACRCDGVLLTTSLDRKKRSGSINAGRHHVAGALQAGAQGTRLANQIELAQQLAHRGASVALARRWRIRPAKQDADSKTGRW
jgi:CHASE3 domain sensor protein